MEVPAGSVLIVTDVQLDFLPGGALAVAGAERILAPLAALMRTGVFRDIVAAQDWHPRGHVSFASAHPGRQPFEKIPLYGHEQELWPDHCIAGTAGAALHSALPLDVVRAIIRKGTDPAVDSYSVFRSNFDARGQRPSTGLSGYLRDCGLDTVYLCGLTRDYCVRASALDAVDLGFRTHVLLDLTQAVSPASDAAVRAELARAGVEILDTAAFR